jgi:hypothetical protein
MHPDDGDAEKKEMDTLVNTLNGVIHVRFAMSFIGTMLYFCTPPAFSNVSTAICGGICVIALMIGFWCYITLDAKHDAQDDRRQARAANATPAEKRAMAEERYPELFRPGGPTLLDIARLSNDRILTRPACAMNRVDMAIREVLEAHLQSFTLGRRRGRLQD